MKHYLFTVTGWSVLILSAIQPVHAQYTVAPNAFVVTAPARSAELIVRLSPDASSMEFDVSAHFAIPHTDSSGNFVLMEPAVSYPQDISSKIRFSPRRFVLSGGDQQIVRITVTDELLPEGEYWSRVVVSAKSASQASLGPLQGLSANMGLEIRTISGFLYRKGDLKSDIVLDGVTPFIRNDTLIVDLDVTKHTPAAWIGTASVMVLDEEMAVLWSSKDPANFYIGGRYRLTYPLGELPAGTYHVQLALETTRDDPTLLLVRAKDVVATFPVVVKPSP